MQKDKQQLRAEIKTCLQSLSGEEKARQSENILKQLEELPLFRQAQTILLYWSLPNEVDTHDFIEKWARRKTILLPVVQGNKMILKYYKDCSRMLTGKFNIGEPDTEEFTDYVGINLCIIPGVAFDKQGNRLGKGKGFYDKFLPVIHAKKIGICFDVQFIENIPHDDWDVKMDLILH